MLDFVGNSVRFNEGYVPPKEDPLDPEMGGSRRRGGGIFVPTVVAIGQPLDQLDRDGYIWPKMTRPHRAKPLRFRRIRDYRSAAICQSDLHEEDSTSCART